MKWLRVLVSGMKNTLKEGQKKNSFEFLLDGENPQVIYALAFLYTYEDQENPYFNSQEIFDVINGLIVGYLKGGNDAVSGSRRQMCPFVQAFHLLKGRLGPIENEFKKLIDEFAKRFIKELTKRERLTRLSSANVGYGTNHLAVEFSGLCAYEKYIVAEGLSDDLGVEDLHGYLVMYLKRFMEYMHADGYWSECDGPATGYNRLTAGSLHKSAVLLNAVEDYRKDFETAAAYYQYAFFPNLKINLLLDGRIINGSAGQFLSTLCFLPETRTIYDACMKDMEKQLAEGKVFSGESLNILTNDIVLGEAESFECRDCFGLLEKSQHRFSDDFGFVKKHGWIISCCNLKFMPRPEGHFNLDFQNLFSIYNDHFGSVVNGGHSKLDPEISTFSKNFMSFDGSALDEPMPKFIPHGGEFKLNENGFKLFREYRGFEGLLTFEIINENVLEITIAANTRLDEYPIDFNFILPLKYGELLKGNVEKRLLGDDAFEINRNELGQEIFLDAEMIPNKVKNAISKNITLELPLSASLSWGFKRYDTYNLETDRHEDIKDSICICKIPIGLTSEKIIFQLNTIS